MSLNIQNEQTHRLVRQLARITGESMTPAVDKAVRERLERVRDSKNGGLAERLLKIGRECAFVEGAVPLDGSSAPFSRAFLVGATKVYSGLGADIVMVSILLAVTENARAIIISVALVRDTCP
jgi:antitoxin VapB